MKKADFTWHVVTLYIAFMGFVIAIVNNSGNGFNDLQIFIFLNAAFAGLICFGWSARGFYRHVDIGTRIFHETYGLGTVTDIDEAGSVCVEYDIQHLDLEDLEHSEIECRNDSTLNKTIRRNCLNWYLHEDLKQLHIIKKAA